MLVESIYDKNVINNKSGEEKKTKSKKNSFKGRLFYAIVTNQRTKMTTFYFSKANSEEARSVARALPFFIRDHFKLEPKYYSGSEAIEECHEGDWDLKKRSFLTMEEKDEKDKFSHLVDTVTAEREIYISDTHRQAMAMEGDDINSVNTRLTTNKAPDKVNENDSMSEITGETRESKAKAYAAQETKKVSLQYIDTIAQLNGNHQNEMEEMQEKLAAIMKQLEMTKQGSVKVVTKEISETINVDMDVGSGLSESNNEATEKDGDEIDEEDEDEDLSEITSSSSSIGSNEDGDESVTIISGKGDSNLETQGNETSSSPFRKKRDSKKTFDFDKVINDGKRKVAKVTPKKIPQRSSLRLTTPPLAKGSERSVL